MTQSILEHPLFEQQTQPQPEQPAIPSLEQQIDLSTAPYDVPVVPGKAHNGQPNWDYRKDTPLPVRPHDVGQVYDLDETQLRPGEDDMVRDEKGNLRSAHAPELAGGWRNWPKAPESPEPQIRSVFDQAESPAKPDLYDEVTGEAPRVVDEALIVTGEAPEVASPDTHHITVRDLGAGATAQQVTIAQPAQPKGQVYQGKSVTAPGTLYGGRLVGEHYHGARRPR